MRKIQLIVTGDLEKLALHTALAERFPDVRNGKRVEWARPRKTHGATSRPLGPPGQAIGTMKGLALAAIVEAELGGSGGPADLVVVVDDGEVGNMDDGANVVAHFRLAMTEVINARASDPAAKHALRQLVRERISYHLLMPMVEAHFFVGRASLSACGVGANVAPKLATADVERFESNDPGWLPECVASNTERQESAPWWRHECHPKYYLQHLLDRSSGGIYEETSASAQKALALVEWPLNAGADAQFARSLFEDLADWFQVPNPMGAGTCAPSTWPGPLTKPGTLLLRNT